MTTMVTVCVVCVRDAIVCLYTGIFFIWAQFYKILAYLEYQFFKTKMLRDRSADTQMKSNKTLRRILEWKG